MTTGGGGVHPGDPWHPDWRPGADEPEEIETGPGAAEEKKPAEPDLADAAEPFDPDAHLEVAPASEPTDEFPDFEFDLDSEAKAEPEVEPEVEPEAETETETEAEAEAEAGEIESASAETVEDALAELEASAARVEVSDEEATAEELVEQEPVAEEPVEPEAVEAETVEPEPVEPEPVEPEPVEPEPVEMVSFEPDTSEAVIAFSATHAEAEAPAEEAAAAESEAAAVKETVEPGSEPDTEETTTRGWDVASGTAELDEEAAGLGYTGVIPAVAAQAIGDEPDKGLEEEPPSRETPDAETPDEDTLEPETPDAETPEPEPAEKAADVEPEKAGTKETEIEETGPTDIGADEIDEAARESLIDHDADTAEVPVVVAGEMESVTTETPVDSDSNADIDIADLQETPTSPGETPEGAAAIGDAPAVTDDPAEDEAWAEFMAADIDGVEAAELEVDEVDISDLQDDTAEHEFLVEDAETTAAQPELFGALGASASEAEELEADAPETDALATDSSKTETLEPESTEPAPSEPDSSGPETPGAEPSELDSPETDSPETDSPETDSPETDSPELGESELPDESEVATAAQVEVVEETELTVEKEMVDALTSDIAPLEFEAFTTQELTEERYAPAPTQEHVGLAEAIAAAESREIEAEAMSAPLDGVDTGVLGVDEIAEDETFFLDDPDDDRDLDHDPDEESVEVDEDSPGAGGSELTLRIASAVLLVSVFGLSLSLGGVAFLVFIGAVSLVALTEFMDVSTESGYRPLRLFAWLGAIGILVGTYTNGPAAIPAGLAATAAVVLAWFGSRSEPPQEPYVSSVVTLFGVAWIPALLSFVLPIAESPNRIALVVSLMLIVAAFDVGSYFVGRALGKRKLAPEISPNKSVEGLIGGVVLALIVALVASVFVEPITALIAVYLAIGISIAAPLGDLSESLVKRHFGVKDMGDILPGHGGLLDRIDGYLFAVPVAYLILLWTGVI